MKFSIREVVKKDYEELCEVFEEGGVEESEVLGRLGLAKDHFGGIGRFAPICTRPSMGEAAGKRIRQP